MEKRGFRAYPRTAALVAAALLVGAAAGGILTARTGHAVPVVTTVAAGRPLPAGSLEMGFAPVVAKVLPAVVNVSSTKIVRTTSDDSPFSDPFFRQFFGDQFNIPRERRESSLGSGVIVSPEGYILTNDHVVDGAGEVKVLLGDKRELPAKIVGADKRTDVAVLKVAASGLPVLPFGDSSSVRPGDIVLAVGNPFGLNQTVTMGIVSATGRGNLGIEQYEDFIQTDAAINPGNSGGALVNARGELIGINTAILSGGSGGNQGIGFAIPIAMAQHVMTQIIEHGRVTRGYLGVNIQQVTPPMAKAFGLKSAEGALVGDVAPGGPAAKAGIKVGDVVLAINGQPLSDSRALQLKVATMAPGTVARLKVLRNSGEIEIPVTLGEMPSDGSRSGRGQGSDSAMDGVSVETLTPDIANQIGVPPGTRGVVVDSVDDSSAAAGVGLRRGDVIEQVNRKPVANAAEYQRAVNAAGNQPVLLLVNRGGTTSFVMVEP